MLWTRQSGASLLQVLIASGIMGVLALAGAKLASNQMQAQDAVRSTGELEDVAHILRQVFQRGSSCAKSGLIGVTVNPTSPATASFTIHTPGPTGPGPIFLQESQRVPGSKWRVTSLRFQQLANIGGRVFFATLRTTGTWREPGVNVEGTMAGKTSSRDTFLNLTLDGANRIIACGGLAPKSSIRVQRTGARQGIAAGGARLVDWNSTSFDVAGEFDNATNRFTPRTPGLYHIQAQLAADDFNSGSPNGPDQFRMTLFKNGAAEIGGNTEVSFPGYSDMTVKVDAYVVANGINDYFDIRVWHDETDAPIGIIPGGNYFAAYLVSPND